MSRSGLAVKDSKKRAPAKTTTYAKRDRSSASSRKSSAAVNDSDEDDELPQTPKTAPKGATLGHPVVKEVDSGTDGVDAHLISALTSEILIRSKHVDWFDIALVLAAKGIVKAGARGKQSMKSEQVQWKGEELRDIFRQRMLPKLQQGEEVSSLPTTSTLRADFPSAATRPPSPRSRSPSLEPLAVNLGVAKPVVHTTVRAAAPLASSLALEKDDEDEYEVGPELSAEDFDRLDVVAEMIAPRERPTAAPAAKVKLASSNLRPAVAVKILPVKNVLQTVKPEAVPSKAAQEVESSRSSRKRAPVNYADSSVSDDSDKETSDEQEQEAQQPPAKKAKVPPVTSQNNKQTSVSASDSSGSQRPRLATKAAVKPADHHSRSENADVADGEDSDSTELRLAKPGHRTIKPSSLSQAADSDEEVDEREDKAKIVGATKRNDAPLSSVSKSFPAKKPATIEHDEECSDVEDGLLVDQKPKPKLKRPAVKISKAAAMKPRPKK